MPEQPHDEEPETHTPSIEELADRPLECTECRKPIAVWYTEIVGNTTTETCMCQDCPELRRRLQGLGSASAANGEMMEGAGLCCGDCGTTLSAIRMGHPLGCSQCYDVFADLIVQELRTAHKLPPGLAQSKRSGTLHAGHRPGQSCELSPSLQLIALNEALKETLGREDYEQAAWLRDQIKELTETQDEEKE